MINQSRGSSVNRGNLDVKIADLDEPESLVDVHSIGEHGTERDMRNQGDKRKSLIWQVLVKPVMDVVCIVLVNWSPAARMGMITSANSR